MNYFPKTTKWLIPEAAFHRSREEMALDGRDGNEGTVLWLGTKVHGEARVTHLVFLRGVGVHKSPLNIQVAPELMREVHEKAQSVGAILVAQIHSHGRHYGVGLSPTDHAYGIRVPYFLSIVCPDYAQTVSTGILDCGVHVFLPDKGFVRLSIKEVTKQIVVDSAPPVEVLIVGDV